jgi:hypothetical protein
VKVALSAMVVKTDRKDARGMAPVAHLGLRLLTSHEKRSNLLGRRRLAMKGGGTVPREMIGFVSVRLEKDGQAVSEMIGCRYLADFAAIQSR